MTHSTVLPATAQRLCERIASYGNCVVAFSGGVDSAVVAAAAYRALGERALAVTAVSPSLSRAQLATARDVARQIGIEHREIATDELDRADYTRNDAQRCYYCKQTLYRHLTAIVQETGVGVIVSGTNADDHHDYRPGIAAGSAADVQTPLADLGLDKAAVRQLAGYWNLSVCDAPASPCLSSRVAYGVAVTRERLAMVEAAEAFLAAQGFSPLRVRLHAGDLARIEVANEQLARLLTQPLWEQTVAYFKSIGFRFVTLDLEGFRSGNLNTLVSLSAAGTLSAATSSDAEAPAK